MRLANAGQLGTLRVGLSRSALDSKRVSLALAALRTAMPGVNLVVSEAPAQKQAEMLRVGEIDMAITIALNDDAAVERRTLFELMVDSAVVSSTDALAVESPLTAALLRDRPLIIVDPHVVGAWGALQPALSELGLTVGETHDSVETVYRLVASGRGWTLAPGPVREHPPFGTVVIPLQGLRVPVSMEARWRVREKSALVSNAVDVLERAVAEEASPAATATSDVPEQLAFPRDVELRLLRSFIAIARNGSLSRAADDAGVSQSALSRQLGALEQEIGFALVDRTSGGATPNAAGRQLVNVAERAVVLV